MLEFDIRLTKDKQLVLSHDFHTLRTHHSPIIISKHTLAELRERTKAAPIVTLNEVLDRYFGKVLLNIELKSNDSGAAVVELLERYIHHKNEWDSVIVSSFRAKALIGARHKSAYVQLALLHDQNPFLFVAYQRKLKLSAVGFHRHYVNRLAVEIAKRTGLFTYVYTIDRPQLVDNLKHKGIDGIVTNYPDRIVEASIK